MQVSYIGVVKKMVKLALNLTWMNLYKYLSLGCKEAHVQAIVKLRCICFILALEDWSVSVKLIN